MCVLSVKLVVCPCLDLDDYHFSCSLTRPLYLSQGHPGGQQSQIQMAVGHTITPCLQPHRYVTHGDFCDASNHCTSANQVCRFISFDLKTTTIVATSTTCSVKPSTPHCRGGCKPTWVFHCAQIGCQKQLPHAIFVMIRCHVALAPGLNEA